MRPALKGALPRAEGENWNLLHRIMHKGFKYGYLKKMVPTVQRFADQLCEKIKPLAEKKYACSSVSPHAHILHTTHNTTPHTTIPHISHTHATTTTHTHTHTIVNS